jgi:predicted NBD/HSP70 family sugar kinase
VNRNDRYIGLDIGGTKTAISLWEGENLLKKHKFFTRGNPAEVIKIVIDTIGRIGGECSVGKTQIAALGISCGGPSL